MLVKLFGSRSGQMFCQAWSGSKLFAKVISRRQKLPLVVKELILFLHQKVCCSHSLALPQQTGQSTEANLMNIDVVFQMYILQMSIYKIIFRFLHKKISVVAYMFGTSVG